MTVLDLHVLTGFLGSGKTTLLRDYLAAPAGAGTAVIVNEAGEIGLDGALLAEGRGGLRMAMLANGCVCCAQGGELAGTIENLLASTPVRPARIVLETSGVSKPGAILRGLQARPTIPLRVGIVSTFDCLRHEDVAAFEEAAAQWAGAQTLVLTRQDLATPAEIATAARAAHAINPIAPLITDPDRAAALHAAFTMRPGALAPTPPGDTAHPRITAFFARQTGTIAWHDLAAWLDDLVLQLGERLLRVKGVVALAGEPGGVLVQSVGTLFSAPRGFPADAVVHGLTVIARDTPVAAFASLAPAIALSVAAPSAFAARQAQPGTMKRFAWTS